MGDIVGTVEHEGTSLVLVRFSESFAGLCARTDPDGGFGLAAAVPVVGGVPRPGPGLPPDVRRAISQLWRDRCARTATPVAASPSPRGPGRNPRGRGAKPTSTATGQRFLWVALPRTG